MTKTEFLNYLHYMETTFKKGLMEEQEKNKVLVPIDMTHPMITIQSLSLSVQLLHQITNFANQLDEPATGVLIE